MSKRCRRASEPDRVILASGAFARLADALDRNDFEQAADARSELIRLGYTVRVRVGSTSDKRPYLKPFQAAHEAPQQPHGPEVANG